MSRLYRCRASDAFGWRALAHLRPGLLLFAVIGMAVVTDRSPAMAQAPSTPAPFYSESLWASCRGSDTNAVIAACSAILAPDYFPQVALKVEALNRRASAYKRNRQYYLALDDYASLSYGVASRHLGLYEQAEIYRILGLPVTAAGNYEQAIQVKPDFAAAWYGLALTSVASSGHSESYFAHNAAFQFAKARQFDPALLPPASWSPPPPSQASTPQPPCPCQFQLSPGSILSSAHPIPQAHARCLRFIENHIAYIEQAMAPFLRDPKDQAKHDQLIKSKKVTDWGVPSIKQARNVHQQSLLSVDINRRETEDWRRRVEKRLNEMNEEEKYVMSVRAKVNNYTAPAAIEQIKLSLKYAEEGYYFAQAAYGAARGGLMYSELAEHSAASYRDSAACMIANNLPQTTN